MPAAGYKQCTKCAEVKPAEAFYRDGRQTERRRTVCKRCMAARTKERYDRDPEAWLRRKREARTRLQSSRAYPEADPNWAHWFAGFIDGEGCFEIRCQTQYGRPTYTCIFSIGLRRDDLAALQEIQRKLGCGRITFNPGGGNRSPSAYLSIGHSEDRLHLVRVLDKHPLRAKKAVDYAIWREAVIELDRLPNGNARQTRDLSRMAELHQLLRDARQFEAEVDLSCLNSRPEQPEDVQ